MSKQSALKILVLALILVAIMGIWAVKNKPTENQPSASFTTSDSAASLVQPDNDTDFILETSTIDLESLSAYGLPLIIDFGSDSCIPCKEMAPVLQTMNAEMQGKAIIKFVDVWKNQSAADGFPVQVIPTQILIGADGNPYVPSEDITSQIELTQYTYKDTGELAFTVHQGGLTEEQMRLILSDMGVEE
ncbi:MAG: thioredoxin family protein [Oscillibacter sp.]|jgi:thioredoxin 1|nr:thioredoxin family protein [Oscillibacter sp.]